MARRITTAQELLDCVPQELPWGYAVGALPRAPDDTVVWLKPLRLGEAIALHMIALERIKPASGIPLPTVAARQRMVLAATLYRNTAQWRCAKGQPTGDPDNFVPLFSGEEAMATLGDPTMANSAANGFLTALMEVSGWPAQPVAEETAAKADSYEAWAQATGGSDGGRWVAGLLPDVELYLRPFDEATRDLAQTMENCGDKAFTANVPFRSTPYLVADVLRSGPNGTPLLTPEQVRGLWMGLAQALANQGTRLLPLGGWGIQARFLSNDALDSAPGDAGLPEVVARGEDGDATVPPDGSAPVAGDGVDGELQPVPGEGKLGAEGGA